MKDYKDILNAPISLDATIAAVIVTIWAAPVILAFLFIRICIINPLQSLFGDKQI
tara:strand:- start:92 stop:256 length:165 start_codon:yes stop_codon:yes gene_type:complete